ncbi:hypothetical protein BS78_03G001200 [Paspalum vaginatum]|nr:hypothetical protein BS78_03G001200 [Paspalum vaginatum]
MTASPDLQRRIVRPSVFQGQSSMSCGRLPAASTLPDRAAPAQACPCPVRPPQSRRPTPVRALILPPSLPQFHAAQALSSFPIPPPRIEESRCAGSANGCTTVSALCPWALPKCTTLVVSSRTSKKDSLPFRVRS